MTLLEERHGNEVVKHEIFNEGSEDVSRKNIKKELDAISKIEDKDEKDRKLRELCIQEGVSTAGAASSLTGQTFEHVLTERLMKKHQDRIQARRFLITVSLTITGLIIAIIKVILK